MNVQAVTDHNSWFLFLTMTSPGVTADRDAVKHCRFDDILQEIPFGLCITGDAAYEPSKHMVLVHQGLDSLNPDNDNFNYYASQCWIQVKMAFGLMQMKWGILKRPTQYSIANLKWMIQSIGRLHNFVITECLGNKEDTEMAVPADPCDTSLAYLPSNPMDDDGNPIDIRPLTSYGQQRGHSEIRERMAQRIKKLGLQQPLTNCKKQTHDDT